MSPESAATLASGQVSRLIKRGLEFLKNGDIAASRLMLRRAADAGNAQAALLLGDTFDPIVLAELGVFGLTGDRTAARTWYRKAMEFGSLEAPRRIERLAQTNR
jgi:TPR repeat protein